MPERKHQPKTLAEAYACSDEELLDLLSSERDTLTRVIVDEIVRRGERMVEPLSDIIRDDHGWHSDGDHPCFWAPIHAAFILGAIGSREAIVPLIAALRRAHEEDCDWVWEAIPPMFGTVGEAAIPALRAVVEDRSNHNFVRGIALDALGAIALKHPVRSDAIFNLAASILTNQAEDMDMRGSAGSVLLHLEPRRYEKSLLAFAGEERAFAEEDPSYVRNFDAEDVAEAIARKAPKTRDYLKNWLSFYDTAEIAARQKRWREERSPFHRIISWWRFRKFNRAFAQRFREKFGEQGEHVH